MQEGIGGDSGENKDGENVKHLKINAFNTFAELYCVCECVGVFISCWLH